MKRYFKHSANMRNDKRIKAVMSKFGYRGYFVWNTILEKLTTTENFQLMVDDDFFDELAHDFDLDVMKVIEIVSYLDYLGLITIDRTDEERGILYCKDIEVSFNGGNTFKKVTKEN